MGTFSELFEQLDPDNMKRRGTQFEHVTKHMLLNDPLYEGKFRNVWLWNRWRGCWGSDKGIDLVAECHDGTLWAIQSKADKPDHWITYTEMAKFMSESNRQFIWKGKLRKFDFRLLVATTNHLGVNATDVMKDQPIPIGFVLRRDLDEMGIWPDSLEDLRAPTPVPKRPKGQWAYQGEAMTKVVKGFQRADRGKLIMACGTGKTLVALFIREKLAAERTLVLMPSLQLMKQTIGEWRRNKTVDFDFRAVCSDKTVSKDDDDMPVSSTSYLGLPPTTDPQEIATFLRRRSGPRVVFATYQSSPEIAKAFKLGHVPAFHLAIADEAHRCAAPHSSEFATILDNKNIKAQRRLFMTATPRIYSARVLTTAKEAGYEFASMDDEEKFGKVFHRLTFHEAIQRNLLTDYQVVIIGVDNTTYRDWAERGRFITIDGKEVKDARSVAGQIGLAKAMRRPYDLRRVITFHRLVKGAKEFKASLPEVIDWMPARQRPKGKLWTDYVDGTMSAGERHRRLQCLREVGDGEHAVISNARCLTEGIDVPTLDGVAFIDPKRSEIDIAQAVGRAIRLADGKTIGTIVVPVFIDTDEPNPDVVLKDSAFKPVWDVLLALRAHDEELAQQLDDLRRMLGRLPGGGRGTVRLPPKIHVDIPDVSGIEFARAFNVRIIEQTTASWEFWFGLLEEYVEQHGDANVPARYETADGYRLGQWIGHQRRAYAKGELDPERERRLEELGWIPDLFAAQWEEGYSYFREFAEQNGDANVPARYETADGFALGKWVNHQRTAWDNGDLDPERERRLEELGWIPDVLVAQWEEGYSYFREFVEQHGDANVPARYETADGYLLGSWVSNQRTRHRQGKLDRERERRLGELGWTLDVLTAWWEEGYGHFREFVEQNGHARVARHYKTADGFALGIWLLSQQISHRKGKLDPERERRLRELGCFVSRWDEGYSHLVQYVEQNGHANVPKAHKATDGYLLGSWVSNQRTRHRQGKLDPGRQRRLKKLPGWTWKGRSSASPPTGPSRIS
jgi:superfamily II DNA or RNA helicase